LLWKTIDVVAKWSRTVQTYSCAVFIRDVAMLESKLDLLLELIGQLIIAINHIGVASASLDQVLDLLRSDASPVIFINKIGLG
jgi:hypothetical protein